MTPTEIQETFERFLTAELGNEDPTTVGLCMVAYAVDFMAAKMGQPVAVATVGGYADLLTARLAGARLADQMLAETLAARH